MTVEPRIRLALNLNDGGETLPSQKIGELPSVHGFLPPIPASAGMTYQQLIPIFFEFSGGVRRRPRPTARIAQATVPGA
jgi:hypothetical protein